MALITMVNLGISFVFNWLLLRRLGASTESDAVFAALIVPQAIIMILATVTGKALAPHLASLSAEDQRGGAWEMAQIAFLFFCLAAWILEATSHHWVGVFFGAYSSVARAMTERLVETFVWLLPVQAVLSVAQGLAYAQGRFFRAELSGLLGSIAGLTLLLVFLPIWGGAGYARASLLRAVVSAGALVGVLGPFQRVRFRSSLPGFLWKRMGILTGGAFLYKMTYLVDRVLSALAPAGGLSLFQVSQQFYGAGEVVLQKAISGPVLARMAGHLREGDERGAEALYRGGVRKTVFLAVGIIFFLVLFGLPALRLIFYGGRLSDGDIRLLWLLLLALGGQLLSPVVLALSNRYYALGIPGPPPGSDSSEFPFRLRFGLYFSVTGVYGVWRWPRGSITGF
ncbi:MAG: hypothetical protein IPP35_04215 [Elusimicrobia bacterium]|nr:hypothetical protein [Elusimicrobiota bacterium]